MLNSSVVQPFLLQLEVSSCFFSWPIFNPTSKLNSVLDPSGFKIKTLAEYWKIKFKNQFYLHNIMTYFILIIFSFLFLHEKYNIAVSLWGLRTDHWSGHPRPSILLLVILFYSKIFYHSPCDAFISLFVYLPTPPVKQGVVFILRKQLFDRENLLQCCIGINSQKWYF